MELEQTAIFLVAAVIAVPLFKRLGLGAVLGYLVAGGIIGPSGLGLVGHVEETLHFAEFGVVLLLFIIGLELQPSRLWAMRRSVFGLGASQVLATAAVLACIGLALGLSFAGAVIAAFALSFSSTALVLQILAEKQEVATAHGRAGFSILLFQDLAAIPLLAVIGLLATSGEASSGPPQPWLVVPAVLLGIVLVGRFLLRPFFRVLATVRSVELSTASALLVVVGTALAMRYVGLSMELGAFMAGVLLADSEYRHDLEANIEPFKGLLLGLFFMAVGMAADFGAAWEQAGFVTAAIVGLVGIKAIVLWGLGRVTKMSTPSTVSLAITLSQGGEFAFVILGAAAAANVLALPTVELLVVVVTGSMISTPLLLVARDRWLRTRGADDRPFDAIENEPGRIIIAGLGRYGQIAARLLRVLGIPFTALEASSEQVDLVRKFGNPAYFGDASRLELLRAAGIDRASVLVLAIDDVEASVKAARAVRQHFPHVKVLARARNRNHAHELMALGVHHVQRETLLSSLDTTRAVLEEIGFDPAHARMVVSHFQQRDEHGLREQLEFRDDQQALIASAKQITADLERIFREDATP